MDIRTKINHMEYYFKWFLKTNPGNTNAVAGLEDLKKARKILKKGFLIDAESNLNKAMEKAQKL